MFYHYGEIRAIKVVPRQSCAFVEFTTRESAQRAAKAKYNNCVIKVRIVNFLVQKAAPMVVVCMSVNIRAIVYWRCQGVKLAVNWSKDVKHGNQVCPCTLACYVTMDSC